MAYFIGTIQSFGINFCPEGWLPCMGQTVQISEYTSLYSLIFTRFGGDGRVTFGIPDLRGRVPMGFGQGPGLTWRTIGNMPGIEALPLSQGQLPVHNHPGGGEGLDMKLRCNSGEGDSDTSADHSFAKQKDSPYYSTNAPSESMKAGSVSISGNIEIGDAGASQYHNNMQPGTVFTYCICWDGTYPRRS